MGSSSLVVRVDPNSFEKQQAFTLIAKQQVSHSHNMVTITSMTFQSQDVTFLDYINVI